MTNTQVVVIGLLVGCTGPTMTPEEPESGTLVRAREGGVVRNGDVSLVIPPGSLASDTVIEIDAETDAPTVESDGFAVSGAAFRFSPPGTAFSLARPAILTMPYDPAALAAQGLDGRTLQLAYYDEQLGRYFSIGGELDPETGLVTARVEHFTLYVALAASLVPGNNAPTIALQSPLPSLLRAASPVYVRATIRDYDVGGSIAGARLHYRSVATSGAFKSVAMTSELTLDTFGALIPAADVLDSGTAVDLEYFVTAVDNLGASRQSTQATFDLTRTYAPGTLVLSPATPAIAAGFERTFSVQGRDETNALYALVPETAGATNGIGATRIGATGVTFRALTVGAGSVTARFGSESASLPVSVFNGALDRIAILDGNGLEIDGTLVIKEGQRVQLDALGYDAFGNSILVSPTWDADDAIGAVGSDGELSALHGQGGGAVTATVGDVTGTQHFYVQPRFFNTSALLVQGSGGRYLPRMTSLGTTPYAGYVIGSIFVEHRRPDGVWVSDGSPDPFAVSIGSFEIEAGTSRLQVAWYDGASIFSAHLDDGVWVRDGGALEVEPGTTSSIGYQPHGLDLAMDGDTPYLASWEANTNGAQVFVRRWNGTAWILLGGPVGGAGVPTQEPSIEIVGGVPHIAVTRQSGPAGAEVYVYRWSGSSWVQLGDELGFLAAEGAIIPRLRSIGGKPTVAFIEVIASSRRDLHVRQWNGTTWSVLMHGIVNGLHVNDVELAADGDVPYVVWTEHAGPGTLQRRVASYNARTGLWMIRGEWTQPLSTDAFSCAITVAGATPYVAGREDPDPFPIRVSALQ